MGDMVLSKEEYLMYLEQKYLQRLERIVWGGNIHTIKKGPHEAEKEAVDRALLFTTDEMSEQNWTRKQKVAFENALISFGFSMRMDGKKNKQGVKCWAFPAEPKETILKKTRVLYEKSYRKERRRLMDLARDEIRAFCNSKWQTTVIKTENTLYRDCVRFQLEPGVGPSFLKKQETSHGDWIFLSKTGNFFNLLESYERDFNRSAQFYMNRFLMDLNMVLEIYHKRRLDAANKSRDRPIVPNKFVAYFPICIFEKFRAEFEEMGMKAAYFPTTYESSYIPLGIKINSFPRVFIEIEKCREIRLPYNNSVNEEYRKFCMIFH